MASTHSLADFAHRALHTTAILTGVSLALVPLAVWKYGGAGGAVLAIAALTVGVSWFLGAWVEYLCALRDKALAGVLAAMAIRMMLPLGFVLAVANLANEHVSQWSSLFVVPLYLAMLLNETTGAARRSGSQGGPPQRRGAALAIENGNVEGSYGQ